MQYKDINSKLSNYDARQAITRLVEQAEIPMTLNSIIIDSDDESLIENNGKEESNVPFIVDYFKKELQEKLLENKLNETILKFPMLKLKDKNTIKNNKKYDNDLKNFIKKYNVFESDFKGDGYKLLVDFVVCQLSKDMELITKWGKCVSIITNFNSNLRELSSKILVVALAIIVNDQRAKVSKDSVVKKIICKGNIDDALNWVIETEHSKYSEILTKMALTLQSWEGDAKQVDICEEHDTYKVLNFLGGFQNDILKRSRWCTYFLYGIDEQFAVHPYMCSFVTDVLNKFKHLYVALIKYILKSKQKVYMLNTCTGKMIISTEYKFKSAFLTSFIDIISKYEQKHEIDLNEFDDNLYKYAVLVTDKHYDILQAIAESTEILTDLSIEIYGKRRYRIEALQILVNSAIGKARLIEKEVAPQILQKQTGYYDRYDDFFISGEDYSLWLSNICSYYIGNSHYIKNVKKCKIKKKILITHKKKVKYILR